LTNDNLNTIISSKYIRGIKTIYSIISVFLVLSLYFYIVLELIILTDYLKEEEIFPEELGILRLEITIPASLNILLFYIFDYLFYDRMSVKLTDFENHQKFSDYEEAFILKRYMFSFLSL